MSFNNVKDQAYSTLLADITASDTSFYYVTDGGANFPDPPYKVVFYDEDPEFGEVVQVTAQSGDSVTACVRGCDGTTAQAWEAGTNIRLLILASHITELQENIADTTSGHDHDGTDSKKISYTNLEDVPTEFTPSSHTHPGADITSAVASATNADNADTVDGYHASDFAPASKGVTNGDSHDHVGGDGASITEDALSLSDVTTGDVSTSKHGFAPKAPNDTSKFLRGDASWATLPSASESASGIVELATSSEINTGTDNTRAISPDALAGSYFGRRIVTIKVISESTSLSTGDGQAYFTVPAELNGMNLVSAHACVYTVSSSGTPTVQLNHSRYSADILSTSITIDANEYTSYTASTQPVINSSYDDVQTGDTIRIDVDVAGTGTKGLDVILSFSLP